MSEDPPPEGAYARGAATMLMGSDGIVPEGAVSRALLRDDPDAPFGRRLDRDKVLDRRRRHVGRRRPVRRAGRGVRPQPGRRLRVPGERRAAAGPARRGARRRRRPARRRCSSGSTPSATPSSCCRRCRRRRRPRSAWSPCRPPGSTAACSQSATTRRGGYVQLADVAPDGARASSARIRPSEMEGRGVPGHRGRRATARGRSPTRPTPPSSATPRMVLAVTGIMVGLALLTAATAVARTASAPGRRRCSPPLAYAALGLVPGHVRRRPGRRRAGQPAGAGA